MPARKPMQRTIRGGRAFFFQDPATDKLLNMLVTLAGEVWTLRERLAATEAIGVRRGALSSSEVDDFEFSAEQEAQLAQARKEFIENLFRVLQEQADDALRRAPVVESTVKSATKGAIKGATTPSVRRTTQRAAKQKKRTMANKSRVGRK